VAKLGEPSRDGILLQLFHDLDRLEANEEGRMHPPLKEFGDQPRKLLVQLYGKPKGIKTKDKPRLDTLSDGEKARLIEQGLIYDRSEKLDRAVRDLFVASGDDDFLAFRYIKRLLGRGCDAEIEAYCRRRLSHFKEEDRGNFLATLDKLGWTPLHVAVDRNDLDEIRVLLGGRARPEAASRNGMTPVHLAAAAGRREAAKLLVQAGAALDPKDKDGRTPVQLAVQEGYLEVVRFLADRGCSLPDVLVAAAGGRGDRVEAILRADAGAIKAKTQMWEQTPLHLAAWSGQPDVVGMLVAKGLPVDVRDPLEQTPLHLAAGLGNDAVVRELLRLKANVRARMIGGEPDGSFRPGAGEGGPEPLHLAAANGHAKVATILLDAKASLEAKVAVDWKRGMTPLHLAAEAGHAGVIDVLLKRGAGVDVTNAEGRTPLHLAAMEGRVPAAERLLAAKAAVDPRDEDTWTPLHIAVMAGHPAMVKLLLAHKADVAAKDGRGRTALDLARESKEQDVIKLLEPPGAKP
jgi:ankyrin repeat protein